MLLTSLSNTYIGFHDTNNGPPTARHLDGLMIAPYLVQERQACIINQSELPRSIAQNSVESDRGSSLITRVKT